MRTFDRIVLAVLALGIWALVLKPTSLTAHGSNHSHDVKCAMSGLAYGDADDNGDVTIFVWGHALASCDVG